VHLPQRLLQPGFARLMGEHENGKREDRQYYRRAEEAFVKVFWRSWRKV
jgi:hypothetical protein